MKKNVPLQDESPNTQDNAPTQKDSLSEFFKLKIIYRDNEKDGTIW